MLLGLAATTIETDVAFVEDFWIAVVLARDLHEDGHGWLKLEVVEPGEIWFSAESFLKFGSKAELLEYISQPRAREELLRDIKWLMKCHREKLAEWSE